MLLTTISSYIGLLAVLGVHPAFCDRSIQSTVADINAVTESARLLGKAVDDYRGGAIEAIEIGNRVNSAQEATNKARKNLDADDKPFTADETPQAMAAYDNMIPVVVSTLHKVSNKAPEFKKAGVGRIARGMVDHLFDEKNRFEEAYVRKISAEDHRYIMPSADEVDAAFQDANVALS
ncbi:hypothetical protein BBP40_008552 [Aspergillus hancockii]|nr:hypothetical protein BBP40_008552 [Aspergillus hancockii]